VLLLHSIKASSLKLTRYIASIFRASQRTVSTQIIKLVCRLSDRILHRSILEVADLLPIDEITSFFKNDINSHFYIKFLKTKVMPS
ncbi:hypothetical protein CYY_009594, partial [Polysphondylium violaceum]